MTKTNNKLDEEYLKVIETRDKPHKFVVGAYPWGEKNTPLETRSLEKWQIECLKAIGEAIREKEKTNPNNYVVRCAVKSGQGVGKTALISMITQWFISTRKNPQIVVTANTENQLKNVVWQELSKWHQLLFNKDLFEWLATSFYLKERPESWKAVAVPYNESRPEAFQGIHADDVLAIFDEASGIPEIIYNVVEGTIKTGRCILIAFSNPTKNTGFFREAFGKNKHRWVNITVDSREVSFANKEEFEQDIIDYGEDSDYVRVRIKGEFPRSGSNQLISSETITKCINYEDKFYHDFEPIIGVDVARFGDDESVICVRQGRKVHNFFSYRGLDGKQLAQETIRIAQHFKTTTILVDGIGVGASPYDFLKHFGYSPVDVQSGETANQPHIYGNKRAEMYGLMKEAMVVGLDLPNNEHGKKFKEQAEGVEYFYKKVTILCLLKKELIKKACGGSPDYPDSLALTFAYRTCKLKKDKIGNQIKIKRVNNINLTKLR